MLTADIVQFEGVQDARNGTMLNIAKHYLLQHCPTLTLSCMILLNMVLLCKSIAVLQKNCRRVVVPALTGEIAAQVYLLLIQIPKVC